MNFRIYLCDFGFTFDLELREITPKFHKATSRFTEVENISSCIKLSSVVIVYRHRHTVCHCNFVSH